MILIIINVASGAGKCVHEHTLKNIKIIDF